MIFLIQQNLFSDRNQQNLIHTLEKLKCEFYFFKHIPFISEIIFEENFKYDENCKYWIFGSVNSCRIFESKYSKFMNPGTFFNSNFDFSIYKDIWNSNLLNFDSEIQSFNDSQILNFPCFIRPCEDSKLFNAKIFESEDDWNFTKNQILNHNQDKIIQEDIQISSIKKIFSEIRCFVINKKVLTASFYRRNNRTCLEECFDVDVLEFVQNRIDEWIPIENFVIDVARTENGLKIIEIGCINCAGFYDINLEKLLTKIIKCV